MKILKRNQIIISVLALMLITVGYMSFSSNLTNSLETGASMDAETIAGLGDAKLVNSSNAVMEQEDENTESAIVPNLEETSEENTVPESSSNNTETSASSTSTKPTSAISSESDYFVTSRMERDKMYSQMLETYQGIITNATVSAEQKGISTQEISNINNQKNSIMIAENLIKNLGFEDVVIFVNYNSTSVIIKAEHLEESDVAKIQNIVCREIGVTVESIHISLKN